MRMLMLVLVTASSANAAQVPVLWAGHLEEAGVAVNRNVTAAFTVKSGDEIVSETIEASLPVVAGDFVVELLMDEDRAQSLNIVVNGADLGEEPLLANWPRAAFADSADRADRAELAGVVGTIDDPTARMALASGGIPVAIANVFDFPAAFLDGDQGLVLTPSSSFTFSNGQLALAAGGVTAQHLSGPFGASDLALNAVTTSDLANNNVNGAKAPLGSVPLSAVAAATLTSDNMSVAANRTLLFEVTRADCQQPLGSLTTDPDCTFISAQTCTTPFGTPGRINCDGDCGIGSGVNQATFNCDNTIAGRLVFK